MSKKKIFAGVLCFVLLFGVFKLPSLFASGFPMTVEASSEGLDTIKAKNVNPDVNRDGYVNEKDTQMLREILIGKSDVASFDVNCDEESNVKDLVAHKRFLTNIWQRDNNLSVNDL